MDKTKEKATEYKKILQNKAINILNCVNDKMLIENKLKGTKEISIDKIKVIVTGQGETQLSTRTNQILDYFLLLLAENLPHGNKIKPEVIDEKREITINLIEFMEMFGLKSQAQARTQLIKAIKSLYNISLEWEETRHIKTKNGKKQEVFKFAGRILNSIGINGNDKIIKNNIAIIKFDMDFSKGMAMAQIMPYDTRILKLNPKSSSYDFAKALLYFYNINYFKSNKGIISVKSLLKWSAKIPQYNELAKQGMIKRRIIDPFENALDELEKQGIIKEWTYTKGKGEFLTDKELENKKYQDWINWDIHFDMDMTRKRITRKKKTTVEGEKRENL